MQLLRDGVRFYASNIEIKNVSIEKDCEVCLTHFVECNLPVVCIYRSPAGEIENFFASLNTLLSCIDIFNSHEIIGGDFNIHFNKNSRISKRLYNFFLSFGLNKICNFATRLSCYLDNIFTNFSEVCMRSILPS